MRAWLSPDVPSLPGTGTPLHLHDTSSNTVRETLLGTEPGAPARMYVCGITPYDAAHLGHAATYLAFDIAYRVWLDAGREVHYVQNVTDIDDPLLERANQTGDDWQALAERETELFRKDMTALRVLPPQEYVGAVEYIPRIVEVVSDMLRRGIAYWVDTDVYFPISAAPGFGSESGYDREKMLTLFAERGGTRGGRASATRWTPCSGAASARASRTGMAANSARAGRAGTSSARSSRSTTSAWASTSRPAART